VEQPLEVCLHWLDKWHLYQYLQASPIRSIHRPSLTMASLPKMVLHHRVAAAMMVVAGSLVQQDV